MPSQIQKILPSTLWIKTIVAKVSAKNVCLNKRKDYIPGFFHCIQSCNAMIFEENENSSDLLKLCSLINQSMDIFRISGTIGPQQSKNIISVDRNLPFLYDYTPIIELQAVFIQIKLPLVESKIRQRLANSEISDDGSLSKRISWNNEMEIIRVKGCVGANKGQEFFEFSGNPKFFQSLPSFTDNPGTLFIGRNLNLNSLYDFILDCRSHISKIPLKTRKFITEQEIDMIENNLAENSEYIFDGSHFVDTLGKRYKKHPDLEQAVVDYIEAENEKIGSINRSIEKEASLIKKDNTNIIINQVFA